MLQARTVTVGTTATELVGGYGRSNKWSGTLLNEGAQTVYIDGSAAVTADDYPLAPAEVLSLDLYKGDAVWGLTSSGTSIVKILEQFWP